MFRKLTVLSFVLILLLAACAPAAAPSTAAPSSGSSSGAGSSPATSAPANVPATGGSTKEVKISNFAFDPETLTVPVGTTVKWTNADSAEHTVTADDKSFDSGSLAQGKSFSFTFTKEGTFSYACSFHPTMKAKVVVTK